MDILQTGKRVGIAPAFASALIAAAILTIAKLQAPFEILIADRFLPGAGWGEILALSVYAGWLVGRLIGAQDTSCIRVRIWILFSVVFFSQFILGVSGLDRFLMTGTLHIPVPAVVIAGPIYRGERFFMPILFFSTLLLVGPAWCSHLCYIGAWDGLSARARTRSTLRRREWQWIRAGIFVATPVVAMGLRFFGVSAGVAGAVAIVFGILSVGSMVVFSRRSGSMVHCTSICPLGMAGNILGKISPFRIRIASTCTDCARCISVCRYGALSRDQIARRHPGLTCTLCGDCISACNESALRYAFFRLNPTTARKLFLVIVVALHAVFIGVARI